MDKIINLAVIMTCYNRREKTVASLLALFGNDLDCVENLRVYLVDDGGTDGTSEYVVNNFPMVIIIKTNGNLFWNRGMHLAFSEAMKSDFDAFLWLNDDTNIYIDSISRLISTHYELLNRISKPSILVGSTVGDNGLLSYGGSVSVSKLSPFKYRKVWSSDNFVECEVMNGNCVFIPRDVAEKVGNLEYSFEHAMGDIDYSLRARNCGFKIFVLSGYVGVCSINSQNNTFTDNKLSISQRWRHIKSKKGLPFRSWFLFTRRHGGFLWPIYFVWPYLKLIFK